MQPLGLHQLPTRTLETPQHLTEVERLRHLMTYEVTSIDPDWRSAWGYFLGAIALLFVEGIAFRMFPPLGLLGLLSTPVYGWFIVKGIRERAPSASQVVLKAKKFPILYLRPFAADSESKPIVVGSPIFYFFVPTPEKELIAPFGRRLDCPVVAVSNPSEEEGSLGALRVWVGHDAWQHKVREFIRYAPLVLLRLGGTEGAMWELEQVIQLMCPERLVLLLPDRVKRSNIAAVLNRMLPRPVDALAQDTRIVIFDALWNPIQIKKVRDLLPRLHNVPQVSSQIESVPKIESVSGPVWTGSDLPEWKRLVYTFIAPSRTFSDIRRGNQSWRAPLGMLVLASICVFAAASWPHKWTAWDGLLLVASAIGGPALVLCVLFIESAAIAKAVDLLFHADIRARRVLTVALYADMPVLIGLVIQSVATLGNAHPSRWFNFGLAAFGLWSFVLLSIGIAIVAGVKRRLGFVAVLAGQGILWAVGLAVGVVITALVWLMILIVYLITLVFKV